MVAGDKFVVEISLVVFLFVMIVFRSLIHFLEVTKLKKKSTRFKN